MFRQSRLGMGSCVMFVVALALACLAWLVVNALKPTRPNHMDMSGVAMWLVAVASVVLIALVQLIGLILGLVGLRQTKEARSTAHVGTIMNVVGLLCTVVAALVVLR